MTPGDRETMLTIWDQWKHRILEYARASGRPFTVEWMPPFRTYPGGAAVLDTRKFTFETRFGCLSNWEVWCVTCEGELVEYGV